MESSTDLERKMGVDPEMARSPLKVGTSIDSGGADGAEHAGQD